MSRLAFRGLPDAEIIKRDIVPRFCPPPRRDCKVKQALRNAFRSSFLLLMGCAESREETPAASSSRPFLDDYRSRQHDAYDHSISATMGQPPQQQQHGIPLAGSSRLAQQHERLILELLPFKNADQFQE